MTRYEYKIVEVPSDAQKSGWFGSKKEEATTVISGLLNEAGASGWDYVRRESLTCRKGGVLRRKSLVAKDVLVFRRAIEKARDDVQLAEQLRPEPVAPRRVSNTLAIQKVRAGERRVSVQQVSAAEQEFTANVSRIGAIN